METSTCTLNVKNAWILCHGSDLAYFVPYFTRHPIEIGRFAAEWQTKSTSTLTAHLLHNCADRLKVISDGGKESPQPSGLKPPGKPGERQASKQASSQATSQPGQQARRQAA